VSSIILKLKTLLRLRVQVPLEQLIVTKMKYKKQSIKGYKVMNMYPVYIEGIYYGHEPFKVVGIRENQVELEGDFSGGTHNVCQKDWFDDDKVFVVKTVCDEQLKPNGCQIHNVNCCGGGSVINKHVSYWDALVS
jgi:hypothetical protein